MFRIGAVPDVEGTLKYIYIIIIRPISNSKTILENDTISTLKDLYWFLRSLFVC